MVDALERIDRQSPIAMIASDSRLQTVAERERKGEGLTESWLLFNIPCRAGHNYRIYSLHLQAFHIHRALPR